MRPIKTMKTLAKVRAGAQAKRNTASREIPIYLQIIASLRRHGFTGTPAEAYRIKGKSKEVALSYEIARLSAQPITKLTRGQLIQIAKQNVAQAYRAQIPNPTAAIVRRK
ncbi:MAG: hypothetical protein WCW44_00205 [archaeon]|jgi:hypothetical protein